MQASCNNVQVALGRDQSSMQSVRKASLHLGDDEAEPRFFIDRSVQPVESAQHAARNEPVETDKRAQDSRSGAGDTCAAEPQPEILQQCDAFQVQYSVFVWSDMSHGLSAVLCLRYLVIYCLPKAVALLLREQSQVCCSCTLMSE